VTDNWQSLGSITARIVDRLNPETFSVPLQGPLAEALRREASRYDIKPETLIAEAVRSYLGDAA
jgi:hypothetical protein